MKKFILFFVILLLSPMSFVQAKRSAPQPVEEIIFGIKYSANLPGQKMGYLYAYGAKTNMQLWEKKIYNVYYAPGLEEDVQDVWISDLQAEGDTLIVVNEKGDRYKVDPNTGEVLNSKNRVAKLALGAVLGLVAIVVVFILMRKFLFTR